MRKAIIPVAAASSLKPGLSAPQRLNRRRKIMASPDVSMQALLEAGAHFGHQTHRWNPKMKPYIFGERNGVHIIDLSQTVGLFARALDFVRQSVGANGTALFGGPQA